MTVKRLDTATVREKLGEVLDASEWRGYHTVVTKHDKDRAAIIPMAHHELLMAVLKSPELYALAHAASHATPPKTGLDMAMDIQRDFKFPGD